MLTYRNRIYCAFVVDVKHHNQMIDWKKKSKRSTKPLPCGLFLSLQAVIGDYFNGFDLLTVPAPSFHTYAHYPIWDIAKDISESMDIKLINLFPDNSGKTKMQTFGSCGKAVQDIECPPQKFVLILDDIYTTGHTMRVSCEAIAKKGSFPVGLAIA